MTLRRVIPVLLTFAIAVDTDAQTQSVPPGSASVRVSGSSLGRIRLGAADPAIWFGWRIGVKATAFRQMTFSDAAAKADALGLASIEGSDSQKVSHEIPKPLDFRLQTGERAAINNRLRDLNVNVPAYQVEKIGTDDNSRRAVFDFAKSLSAQSIVCSPDPGRLEELDKLANEYGINIAIRMGSRKDTPEYADPKSVSALLQHRSKRIGVSVDLHAWTQEGIKPKDGLALLKDRVLVLNVRAMGNEAAGLDQFFLDVYRLELKPLFITIEPTGASDVFADLLRSVAAFEKILQPAMMARVAQMADSPQGAIRGPEKLSQEVRGKIEAAVPARAISEPKKPRKLLVMDLNMYSGHGTIPHGNLLLEVLGKKTGAFEAVFSNDLNNLKYPKIRQFDAVFLNSMAGMMFQDPAARDGLIRYVREGGGLGGVHATTYAAMDWPEFTEMIGAGAGEHRTEKQVLKVDDPKALSTQHSRRARSSTQTSSITFPPALPTHETNCTFF